MTRISIVKILIPEMKASLCIPNSGVGSFSFSFLVAEGGGLRNLI